MGQASIMTFNSKNTQHSGEQFRTIGPLVRHNLKREGAGRVRGVGMKGWG